MIQFATQNLGRLGYGSLYLPGFVFAFLAASTPEISIRIPFTDLQLIIHSLYIAIFAALSLSGGFLMQGLFRAIVGPEGPRSNPKSTETYVKHMPALIAGVDAEELKGDTLWERSASAGKIVVEQGKFKRFITLLLWGAQWPSQYLALIGLIIYILQNEVGLIPVVLTVVLFGSIVGEKLFDLFPSISPNQPGEWIDTPEYIKNNYINPNSEIEIFSSVFRLAHHLQRDDGIESLVDFEYNTRDGGSLFVEYVRKKKFDEDMRDELESVSYDYAVTLGKSDYPCKEAEFRVHDEYSLVGEYCIETEWAWELLERDITATQYSERVFDNMTYWSKLSERELGEHAREYFNYILE